MANLIPSGGAVEAVAAAAGDVASSIPSKPASAMDMMRYQKIAPDSLSLDNVSGGIGSQKAPAPPADAASWSPARDYVHQPSDLPDPNRGGGSPDAAMLLQWGQTKRSRGRRDPAPAAAAPAGASPAIIPGHMRRQPALIINRRGSSPAEILMPPPNTLGPNLRNIPSYSSSPAAAAAAAALPYLRSMEERVAGKQPASPAPKLRSAGKAKLAVGSSASPQWEPRLELPRISTTLTRKEKEEDFMAMNGTKLPQRPKRRSKQAEKAVAYITPGAWLKDVNMSRYEVRERKNKKGGSGLSAMAESGESSSDETGSPVSFGRGPSSSPGGVIDAQDEL